MEAFLQFDREGGCNVGVVRIVIDREEEEYDAYRLNGGL